MSAWARPSAVVSGLVRLGTHVQTRRVARRLGAAGRAEAEQERTRLGMIGRMSATAYGRRNGIEAGMSQGDWQGQVPVRDYEGLATWIDRMKGGEADVLWPGRCRYFAVSSGTTAGRTKYLPVTRDMLAHFRHAGLESLCCYTARVGHTRVFGGRHLFLGGATSLTPLPGSHEPRGWSGDLSGITARHLPAWVESQLYEPGQEIAQLADWPEKLRAIAARTAGRDIRLLAGIPSWLLILAETMRAHTGAATLKAVWPGLECVVHGGVPIAPFAAELREVLGPGVAFHEVFPASEAFIAAQDAEPEAGLRLLTAAGVYYEFVPFRSFDETRLEEMGRRALTLGQVRAGEDYVLLLTTPAGLCRYVIGDVVRFVTTTPPRLVYVGRTRLQLSAFGEHVIEKELTDTLAEIAAARGWMVVNFHVAPIFAEAAAGVARGCHEWWIELRGEKEGGDAAALADELDAALQRRNEDYEAKRQGGGLDAPKVQLVAPGTFELWMRRRGKWGGQNKMPRCRSDRQVADELAGLAGAD